jgi:murein DD-endopeptidase MepM/ murein hydrolase activator NlpD
LLHLSGGLAIVLSALLLADPQSAIPALAVPIEGIHLRDLREMFSEVHNGHAHEAIDIVSPKGTPVHAVITGRIQKLFLSKAGGNTIYQFDEKQVFCYYYAHLDHYADGLHEGMLVERGAVIGFVGSTGNATAVAPHLHFAIFELGLEKQWWKGTPIDPFPALVAAVRRQE